MYVNLELHEYIDVEFIIRSLGHCFVLLVLLSEDYLLALSRLLSSGVFQERHKNGGN